MKYCLPIHYRINEHDVLCGRGRQCYNHVGNQRFRQMIMDTLDAYVQATTKYDKSAIIDNILSTIRTKSRQYNQQCQPQQQVHDEEDMVGGGFVKKDETTGRWYEVGDNAVVRTCKKRMRR
jgi:hypothetical protein